jgi:hypothetical protein
MTVIGATNLRLARRRIGFAVVGALATLSLALGLAPKSLAAEAPYEPNDSILSATGPLAIDQTYVAGLETQSDMDFFFFYVTSPRTSDVTLTVRNLGGGSQSSDIQATITDSSATPVGGLSFISGGEARTATIALRPQKYFIEVSANTGFGDTYSLTGGGGSGAFGPYAQIAARCASATAAVAGARARLTRAQAKLQRATARLRHSRYSTRDARKAARAAYRKARARVTGRKDALKAAKDSQKPWCSIPQ